MTTIMTKIGPRSRFDLRSTFRQSCNLTTGLSAQRLVLFKKLVSYARLSSWSGTSPVSMFDEKLSVLNFRFPISGGISPESSFSDRSRSTKRGNSPRARGMFPESLFFDRLNVTNDFHEMISSGNSPERLFESRKIDLSFERDVNSVGISPEKALAPRLRNSSCGERRSMSAGSEPLK